MAEARWDVDSLDLDGYLERVGVPARALGRDALDELHEAHVRTFTFDNIDVLLGQHPGVSLAALQNKFVERGRGGYCFEHATLFAAVLERLGYEVQRRLGRVGDPASGEVQGRTHMVLEVALDGQRLLADPGFGISLVRPIVLADEATDDYLGWACRVRRIDGAIWQLARRRDQHWEVMHNTDELAVYPADVVVGHHYTSTFPASHFTTGLILARHLPGRHVTVTTEAVTVRRPGEATEHRAQRPGELVDLLAELEVPLGADETDRLIARVEELRAQASTA